MCFLGGFFKDLRKYWRGKWQPAPVFLPEKFHGQESLVGYSPWGPKESDMNKHTHHQTQKHLLPKLMLFLLYLDSLQLQLVYLHSLVSHWLYLTQIIKTSVHLGPQVSTFIKFKLCNPREGSPPGSPVSGILQARTLEWVAISFSTS